MDTISPIYARWILRELEQRDIDPSSLFASTSLSSTALLEGGDIGLRDFLQVLRAADKLLGDQQLGLLLGGKVHAFGMGPVGAAIAVAPSLREGLQLLEGFAQLHASYVEISAHSDMRGLTVTILYQYDTGDVERFHTETAMLLLQSYMETLLGERVTDARYRLAIPKPDELAEYARALHGTLTFDADANEVHIPHRWLDRPSPYYHAELWRQARISLSRSLGEQSKTQGQTYTQHVVALFRSSEPPLPELADVASDLHMSERTLSRRLRAESTTFRELRADALAGRARLYLDETDYTVEAIAAELGYRDPANFRRAFRKAEGCSPARYRADNRAARS